MSPPASGSGLLAAVLQAPGRPPRIERLVLDPPARAGAAVGIVAGSDDETLAAVREATGGGADFAFEAVGLRSTIELTVCSVRAGGTTVLVGMTPLGVRVSLDAFHMVDRSLRILGSNLRVHRRLARLPSLCQPARGRPTADRAPHRAPHPAGRGGCCVRGHAPRRGGAARGRLRDFPVPGDEVPGDEVPGDEVPGDEVPAARAAGARGSVDHRAGRGG